jgi:hypothetical protein
VVEEAIRLRKARDVLKSRVQDLEDVLINPEIDEDVYLDAETRLPRARADLNRAIVAVRDKERALGVDEQVQLHRLANNPYIAARMNARALKMRLRDKLQSRKFELDPLERSFRKQVNGIVIS